MRQNEAVIHFTKQVLGEGFQAGVNVRTYITKEQRAIINNLMVEGFLSGDVELNERSNSKLENSSALKNYATGVVSNWFNKSKELNGQVTHAIKNPGSRTNEQMKQALALRKSLLEEGADQVKLDEVEAFISSIKASILASKPVKQPRQKKTKQIDLSALPEQFHSLVG